MQKLNTPHPFESDLATLRSHTGMLVYKTSKKPFKSGRKINTVKGVLEAHPVTQHPCYTFYEDDSYVEAGRCVRWTPASGIPLPNEGTA